MSEPVLRAQFGVEIPSGPARSGPAGTFTNNGGVSRYQISAPTEEAPAAPRVSARVVGGVVRTTSSAGAVTTETSDLIRGNSGDLRSTSEPFFHSSGGRALMPDEVKGDSLVTLPNGITTNVRAAIAAGLISQNRGALENATSPKAASQELDGANEQRRAEQQEAEKDTVPTAEPLDAASESIMTDAVAKLGNLDSAELISSLVDKGNVSEDLAARLATSMGEEPASVRGKIDTVVKSMEAQARSVIGNGADEVLAYARENAPQALRKAMMDQAYLGTTKGYAELRQSYMECLADTKQGRALILASPDAQARGVFVDKSTSKLYVDLPKVGRVLWSVAVRQGHIKPGHQR